jgi:C1A family cysteine protease
MFFCLLLVLPLVVYGNVQYRFNEWVQRFEMKFNNDFHRQRMFSNWLENDKHIDTVNGMNLSYTLGHNHFSGFNMDEFREYVGLMPIGLSDNNNHIIDTHKVEVASSVNWVEKGGVTDVKDQGQCGSCWSFSTTGALEGAYYVKYNKLVSFSEQQLVDCDSFKHGGKDHGCNGGLMDNAFNWIETNNGLCSEDSYPYVSGTTKTAGDCQTTCDNLEDSKINKFIDVKKSDDTAMMTALTQQPVSIAIEADQKDFQLYQSGVFTGTCGTGLDHGVLAVGYGSDSGEEYYLVKNSWSSSWGDNGYIKLGKGVQYNNGDGQCGLLLQASYPEV